MQTSFVAMMTLLLGVACSSSSTSSDGSVGGLGSDAGVAASTTQFAGLWAGPMGETGELDVTFRDPTTPGALLVGGATLSGSLTLSSVIGPIALAGVVDASGAGVTFSGTASTALGKFNCIGQLKDGSFAGNCVGADGQKRYFDSQQIGVAPIERYCGTFTGNAGTLAGAFNLFTSGSYAGAVFWSGPLAGGATGTIAAGALNLTIPNPVGSIVGTVKGNAIDGTFTVASIAMGTFTAAKDSCPKKGAVIGGPDAGVVQPKDASPADAPSVDGGVPKPDTAASPDGAAIAACPGNGKIVPLEANDYVTYAAATSGYVFWVQNGKELWRAGNNGSAPAVFATAGGQTGFWGLAAENGLVCWLEGSNNPQVSGGLRCRQATGGNTIAVVNNLVTPEGLSMNNGNLFWFSRSGGLIYKAQAVADSAFEIKYNFNSDLPQWGAQDVITHVVGNDSRVYFAAYGNATLKGAVYSVAANAISGKGTPIQAQEVGSPGLRVGGLATDGRYTYWLRTATSPLAGTMGVHDVQGINGGTLNDYVQAPGAITALAGDNQCYFSDGGNLMKQAPGVGSTATKAAGGIAIAGDRAVAPIAVDESCVYWFGENGGRGIFAKQR